MKSVAAVLLTSLLLFLVPTLNAQTTREASADPAEWAPEDALFYVGITDTAQLWKDLQNTSAYKMTQDKDLENVPNMTGMWGVLAGKMKEQLARLLSVEQDSLKNPLAGPLTFYLSVPPGAGLNSMEGVLVAGVGDQELMKQYFEAALARLKTVAASYETVAAGSQTIHVFTGAKADDSKDKSKTDEMGLDSDEFSPSTPGEKMSAQMDEALDLLSPEKLPEKLAVCLTSDRLIASATPEHVKAVLSRERGGKTLAGTEDHKLLLSILKPVGQIRVLANLPRLFEILRRDVTGDEADSLRQTLDVLGGASLRSAVGHFRVGQKSYDSKIDVLFLMSGERTGLARILSMQNAPVDAPSWTGSNTAAFASFQLDPPKLLDEILRLMSQSDPKAAEEFRAQLEQVPLPPEGTPVNLRKDFIDHLAGPLTAGVDLVRPAAPGSLRGMLSIVHRNRDAITRVLLPLFGSEAKPRDVRGTPVYTEPGSGGSLAIGGDRLLFGSQAMVDSALSAGSSGGLSEDPTFRRALRTVPKEAWCVIYIDQLKLMRWLIDMSSKKEEMIGDPVATMLLFALQSSGMDFSDAKLAKKIEQYSGQAIATVATTTEGVQFTLVGLEPADEAKE